MQSKSVLAGLKWLRDHSRLMKIVTAELAFYYCSPPTTDCFQDEIGHNCCPVSSRSGPCCRRPLSTPKTRRREPGRCTRYSWKLVGWAPSWCYAFLSLQQAQQLFKPYKYKQCSFQDAYKKLGYHRHSSQRAVSQTRVNCCATAETSCTANPQQIAVMELKGYSWPTCSKQPRLVDCRIGVVNRIDRRRVLLTTRSTCLGEIFNFTISDKVPQECTLILEIHKFLKTQCAISGQKQPDSSSVSIQCRLVTDGQTKRHTTITNIALV